MYELKKNYDGKLNEVLTSAGLTLGQNKNVRQL